MAWPPRVLEAYPLKVFFKPKRDPEAQPCSLGGTSLGNIVSPASSAAEQVFPQRIATPDDENVIVAMDVALPDLFLRSLAGSYREGAIRCLLDLAETIRDRPAGMHDIARGQCRSLSEDPRRRRSCDVLPSAQRDPRAIRPLEPIFEDEVGDEIPATHVLFLTMDPNLEPAPFFQCLVSRARPTRLQRRKRRRAELRLHLNRSRRASLSSRIGEDDARCRECGTASVPSVLCGCRTRELASAGGVLLPLASFRR